MDHPLYDPDLDVQPPNVAGSALSYRADPGTAAGVPSGKPTPREIRRPGRSGLGVRTPARDVLAHLDRLDGHHGRRLHPRLSTGDEDAARRGRGDIPGGRRHRRQASPCPIGIRGAEVHAPAWIRDLRYEPVKVSLLSRGAVGTRLPRFLPWSAIVAVPFWFLARFTPTIALDLPGKVLHFGKGLE